MDFVSRSLAYEMKPFVINAVGSVSQDMLDQLPVDDDQRSWLATQSGGAAIYGPRGNIVAGPMEPGEGLLVADVHIDDLTVPKIIQDFGSHRYNRFDLLRLEINSGQLEPIRDAGNPAAIA